MVVFFEKLPTRVEVPTRFYELVKNATLGVEELSEFVALSMI